MIFIHRCLLKVCCWHYGTVQKRVVFDRHKAVISLFWKVVSLPSAPFDELGAHLYFAALLKRPSDSNDKSTKQLDNAPSPGVLQTDSSAGSKTDIETNVTTNSMTKQVESGSDSDSGSDSGSSSEPDSVSDFTSGSDPDFIEKLAAKVIHQPIINKNIKKAESKATPSSRNHSQLKLQPELKTNVKKSDPRVIAQKNSKSAKQSNNVASTKAVPKFIKKPDSEVIEKSNPRKTKKVSKLVEPPRKKSTRIYKLKRKIGGDYGFQTDLLDEGWQVIDIIAGSPADGKLHINDCIVGLNGVMIDDKVVKEEVDGILFADDCLVIKIHRLVT